MEEVQKIALAIINNNSNNKSSINDECIEKIIEYLIKNKISFLELSLRNNSEWIESLLENELFAEILKKERELYQSWETDFLSIKKLWDKHSIDYLFHKSVGSFPYLSDNLDVMVRVNDFEKAGNLLKELGYVNLRNIQEEHKEFYRKFNGEVTIGPIHLHERVCWVVPYEDVDKLWENRLHSSVDPLVYYPGFEDSILINTAHCILEDHVIKLKDLLYIKKCIDSTEINWEYIINVSKQLHWEISLHTGFVIFQHLYKSLFDAEMFPDDIIKLSDEYISKHRWVKNKIENIIKKDVIMPFKLPHLWIRMHTALREYKDTSFGNSFFRLYQIFGGLVDRFVHLKLKIHNQPGMIISVSGLDGSGKTKHIKALQNAFNTCDIKTKIVWSRAGSMLLTRFFSKINRNNLKIKDKRELINRNHSKNSFKIFVWRFLNIIDLVLFYSIKVRFNKYFNKVVICDRYFLDMIVDMEAYEGKMNKNRIMYKILKLLIPSPDLSFFIKAEPEIIIKRAKKELNENIDFNNRVYENFIPGEKIDIIDNNFDFNTSSNKIINKSLTTFFSKYPDKFRNYKVISYRYK